MNDHSDNPAYMAFAARMRKAVRSSGLSQVQVADLANITEVSLSRYMAGTRIPHPIILARICEALGCDANWLIGKKEKRRDNWIPVSKALPAMGQQIFATCKAEGRENWVIDTYYLPLSKFCSKNPANYSDWGNIPLLNWGKAEVVAWMPNNYPEPWEENDEKV